MDVVRAEDPAVRDGSIPPAIEVRRVTRRFGDTLALDGVSMAVAQGEIHALLGPNGAGKTTLLRIITGITDAGGGEIVLRGVAVHDPTSRRTRGLIGLVPSGDRSFYLRISGVENLVFFARLHGFGKRAALERSRDLLRSVGLEASADRPVGGYSHGMQKRLSIARALLMDPPLLFVDEATHDLDPPGAILVRELVSGAAASGAAVVWTTQRIEEIRGFADRVTVIGRGRVLFQGSVPQLLAITNADRFLLQIRASGAPPNEVLAAARGALGSLAAVGPVDRSGVEHLLLQLREGVVLGTAIAALSTAGVDVVACREERSDVEAAFIALTMEDPP